MRMRVSNVLFVDYIGKAAVKVCIAFTCFEIWLIYYTMEMFVFDHASRGNFRNHLNVTYGAIFLKYLDFYIVLTFYHTSLSFAFFIGVLGIDIKWQRWHPQCAETMCAEYNIDTHNEICQFQSQRNPICLSNNSSPCRWVGKSSLNT